MNKILISLIITFLVSIAFGAIGFFGYGNFVSWFGISFVGQYLFFFTLNSIIDRIEYYKYNKLINEREIEIEKNIIPMFCANCNHPNDVHVDVKMNENSFICENCGTHNSVIVSITNAQKTNILYKKDVLTEEDIQEIREKNNGN